MKYTPRSIKDNVNVSHVPPIKDFFVLLMKILAIVLLVYVILGLAVDYIAPRIPADLELKMAGLLYLEQKSKEYPAAEDCLQPLLDNLVSNDSSLPAFDYKVHVKSSFDINAMACPGGNIVILSGLLKEIKSENEISMVLAHELGHYAHRDHLKGLGRGMVFFVISFLMFGPEARVSKLIANSLSSAEMRFSQISEQAADLYALELIHRTYGHAGGALDFYEKMAKKEKLGRFFYIFATHPYPASRVEKLKEAIRNRKYELKERKPVEIFFKTK